MRFPRQSWLDRFTVNLFCAGGGAELVLAYKVGASDWLLGELIALLFVIAVACVTVPFATGTERTGGFHRFVAIAFVAATYVFLLGCISTIELASTEAIEWAKGAVIVYSGVALLLILSPASLLLYVLWARGGEPWRSGIFRP